MSNSYVSLFGQNVALRYNTIQQKKTNPPGRSIAYLYKNHENFDRFLSSLFRVLLARAPQVIRGHSNMMSTTCHNIWHLAQWGEIICKVEFLFSGTHVHIP